jgi:putative SOS response-associated peptidase YedK
MCGRLFQTTPSAEAARVFATKNPVPNVPPRYNGAPTQDILVVRFNPETGERSLDPLHWGLIPVWAKERKIGVSAINARAETIAEKPLFRDAFAKRRCVVPADGFYEWKEEAGGKQPYAVARTDGRQMPFAGLWERWRDPKSGEIVRSFTIVTTTANERLAALHERMPVILDEADIAKWLGEEPAAADDLKGLLRSYPAERLRLWAVDKRVNNVRNQDGDLIKPLNAA